MKRDSKSRVTDHTRVGKVADLALAAAIILAPALGGSSSLPAIPILTFFTLIAVAATFFAARKLGSSIHFTLLAGVLIALALFTLFQAVSLPAGLTAFLSPKTQDLRAFDAPLGSYSISYEVSATYRESTKLFLYALIAIVAYERARAKRTIEVVTVPLLASGLLAAILAVIHRVLGLERMFGVIQTRRPLSEMITTFANPNHTAGFMALACLCGVGMSLVQVSRARKIGFAAAAIVCGMISLLALSRGGMAALAGGLLLFTGLLAVKKKSLKGALAPLIAAVIIGPLLLASSRLENLIWTLGKTGEADLGPAGKLAAMKDALPMISDHLYFGIGRGSYISLYSHYKQSPVQLVFAYPENIAIQLIADWGVIIGPLALIALVIAVVRRLQIAEAAALGALCGVAAVVAQNIVDFSLELPGVALPVAAILGATGVNVAKRVRLSARDDRRSLISLAIPSAVAVLTLILAFSTGDLDSDLQTIADQNTPFAEVEARALRHPTNPYAATLASYAAETASPPEQKAAIRWANRALYYAPTYADGHLSVARILVNAGHRRQGFAEARTAWKLAALDRRTSFVRMIVRIAKDPHEVLLAVPRRDEELDLVDERSLAAASRIAREQKKPEWARVLVRAAAIDTAPVSSLQVLAPEALAAGEVDLAERSARRLRELAPQDSSSALLLAKLYLDRGAVADAEKEAERAASLESGRDAQGALRMLIDIALQKKDIEAARKTHRRLIDVMPPTRQGQVEVAKYEAVIEESAGNPSSAVKSLSRAIDLAPEALALRMHRARVLFDSGHLQGASDDAAYVLARQPKHRGAVRLMARIESLRKRTQPPENEAKSAEDLVDGLE